MDLDVLSLNVSISRWSEKVPRVGLRATVVPADWDSIKIGENYIFSRNALKSKPVRIDAKLFVTDDPKSVVEIGKIPRAGLARDQEPAGCAYLRLESGQHNELNEGSFEHASLTFYLFANAQMLIELVRQVEQVDVASVKINIWLDDLKFAGWGPDEHEWPLDDLGADPNNGSSYLPIRSWGFDVNRLSTTRAAITNARDKVARLAMSESDDPDERKMGMSMLSAQMAEIDSREQTLFHQCRNLLLFILMMGILALFRFWG